MIYMVTSTLVIGLTTLTWYLYKNIPMGHVLSIYRSH